MSSAPHCVSNLYHLLFNAPLCTNLLSHLIPPFFLRHMLPISPRVFSLYPLISKCCKSVTLLENYKCLWSQSPLCISHKYFFNLFLFFHVQAQVLELDYPDSTPSCVSCYLSHFRQLTCWCLIFPSMKLI